MSDQITYADINALLISFPDNYFDIVMFKSVFGNLSTDANQEKAIQEIYRVLKSGGELWFAENLKASLIHRVARKIYRGDAWRYSFVDEILALCKPFASLTYGQYGFLAVFGRRGRLQNMLGEIDRYFDRVILLKWKYIMYGVAKK